MSADPVDCQRCAWAEAKRLEAEGAPFVEVMLETSGRMILCPECGNKRCPRASDHRFECTGSNEPGQLGSVY